MSELLERELSRVLHDLPTEPGPHPMLYTDVQKRARQLRRRRYSGTALAAVIAVAVAITIPTFALGRGNHAAPQPPAGHETPTTNWPARGALVHEAAVRRNAIAAWQRGLTAAHRGKLTEPVREIYADRVANVGLVVVLLGVEPRGGDRTVILTGASAASLSVYVDDPGSQFQALSVLFGDEPSGAAAERTRCSLDTTGPSATRTLFVLGDPATRSARWQAELAQPALGCKEIKSGAWRTIGTVQGMGSTAIQQRAGERINVAFDGPGVGGFGSMVRFPGPLAVQTLSGGRVAGTVPVEALEPVQPVQSQTTTSNGGVAQLRGQVHARASTPNGMPNPFGWGQRRDASSGFDIWNVARERHPEDGDGGQQVSVLEMALPDGTPIGASFLQEGSGPTRFYLVASPADSHVVYIEHVVDNGYDPREVSAVIGGRHGSRWLFVVGEPGVASIEYRAKGSSHWQRLDVYESTGFLKLPEGDQGTGTIRLRTTNGSTVYQGKVDALHPLR